MSLITTRSMRLSDVMPNFRISNNMVQIPQFWKTLVRHDDKEIASMIVGSINKMLKNAISRKIYNEYATTDRSQKTDGHLIPAEVWDVATDIIIPGWSWRSEEMEK